MAVDLTTEEISARQAEETAWSNGALDRALEELRFERNNLLKKTRTHPFIKISSPFYFPHQTVKIRRYKKAKVPLQRY